MKNVKPLLLALLCMASVHSFAQVDSPMYKCSPVNFAAYGRVSTQESIYYPSNFVGMPNGSITAIYTADTRTPPYPPVSGGYNYYGFKVRMLQTTISRYPHGGTTPTIPDTPIIFENEAIVANYPLWNYTPVVNSVKWMKIPLNVNSFYYSNNQNFVIQFTVDSADASNSGIPMDFSTNTSPNFRFMNFGKGNQRHGQSTVSLPMVGFDIAVTDVPGIKNLQSVGLFPNPSSGRFQLSFQSAASVKLAQVSVADGSGRQLYRHSYSNVGVSFFKEVNLEGLPKGIYFLKLDADGEVIKRQVVVK
ncbi:MAG: T9SS type A sorting domain-containing protein [Chitinophagaceae bacterium]